MTPFVAAVLRRSAQAPSFGGEGDDAMLLARHLSVGEGSHTVRKVRIDEKLKGLSVSGRDVWQ